MVKSSEQLLFLTEDKKYLLDDKGKIILMRIKDAGMVYYQSPGVESEAYKKTCKATEPRQVCLLWNKEYECTEYGSVEICDKWEFEPRGYSNIS